MFTVVSIWIGIDDTDSTQGGCTTHVALEVISKAYDAGFVLLDFPHLVRLNPNVPWKTRGNGALALYLGCGNASDDIVGVYGNHRFSIAHHVHGSLSTEEVGRIQSLVQSVVEELAWFDDGNTNPGIVLFEKQPPYDIYKNTAHSLVNIEDIITYLKQHAFWFSQYKNSRGLIGATAAVAWKPTHDHTFELITYRERKNWGTPRKVGDASVQHMDKNTKTTFDNYDYENHHNRLVPSSPCPLLYGIRGDEDKELQAAMQMISSEPIAGWLLFQTNQGTDDHLQTCLINQVQPYHSVQVKGRVDTCPRTITGGHVLFSLRDSTGIIDCAAYEPTKQFRNTIRQLLAGDTIVVCGGVREKPLTINIEKIQIINLVEQQIKRENPVCPSCGKHMKSKGTGQGFKCVNCKTISNEPVIEKKKRQLLETWYEVPVCARRHLSKPLKRIKNDDVFSETG